MAKLFDTIMGRDLTLTAADAALPVHQSGTDITGVATPDAWTSREDFARIIAADLFENHLDEMPVSRSTALSVGAIDRGVQLITQQMSTFPLVHTTAGRRTPVQPILARQPEVGRQRSMTILHTVDAMIFHGRAWWLIVDRYAGTELPRRFEFVSEGDVETDAYGRVMRVRGRADLAGDLIRLDGPHGGILNRPQRIREALAIDIAAFNASENPVPSIDLHQKSGDPLTAEKVDAMKAGWLAARRKRGGGVGYSNPNVEVRTLGVHPEQLLITGRNATALNCARMLNLSAWAVDASVEGSSLTYSNVQGRSRELIDYTLAGYMEAIAGRLSMVDIVAGDQGFRFETSRLTTADDKERAETLKTLVDAGIITPAQAALVLAGQPLESVL